MIRAYKEDWHDRKKRESHEDDFQHPTIVSHEDKWIAGVILENDAWSMHVLHWIEPPEIWMI